VSTLRFVSPDAQALDAALKMHFAQTQLRVERAAAIPKAA
jgi:hypothetical protein